MPLPRTKDHDKITFLGDRYGFFHASHEPIGHSNYPPQLPGTVFSTKRDGRFISCTESGQVYEWVHGFAIGWRLWLDGSSLILPFVLEELISMRQQMEKVTSDQ